MKNKSIYKVDIYKLPKSYFFVNHEIEIFLESENESERVYHEYTVGKGWAKLLARWFIYRHKNKKMKEKVLVHHEIH
jgi:hypothetical protein